jgi:hypothetical protein
MAELKTYQATDRQEIRSSFTRRNNEDKTYTIALANYDKSQALVIDPLIYSTYLGGGVSERGNSIAIDSIGNGYVTGETTSPDFDTTSGAFQKIFGGDRDVFITKINTTGSALVYSTFLGGSDGIEVANSIAIDADGNAYVTGYTNSTRFDITPDAFQKTLGGNDDAFITKFNPSGSALIYSTYLGGRDYDYGNSIAIVVSGNAYVTGSTESTDLDITSNAFQKTKGDNLEYGNDVFITKLNPTGSALVYSTYLGGSGDDYGYSIAIDANVNAYVTGYTKSPDFDITSNAFQNTYGGGNEYGGDAFITKLNPTGLFLVYSTYLGGSGADEALSLAIDDSGNAYVTGSTKSTDFDITADAYQSIFWEGDIDAFVTILNSNGSTLIYSTYLGGNEWDFGIYIAIDNSKVPYVIGNTRSEGFDITPGAFQTTFQGDSKYTDNIFITKLSIIDSTDNTITLSSAAGTDNQTKCLNTAITNIIYNTTGATGATFTGLPAGVTGAFAANKVTISGTPTVAGTFNYTVNLTGGSGTVKAIGTITVTPNNTIALSSAIGTDSQTVIINTPIVNIIYATIGATGAIVTDLPSGVTGSFASNI